MWAVLYKRTPAELADDECEPELRAAAGALIAFATGDLLERQRQYAKAQLKLKEGEAQLAQLLDLERNQSACEQRLFPAEIHAEAGHGKGYW